MGRVAKKLYISICILLIVFGFIEAIFVSKLILFLMSLLGIFLLFLSLLSSYRQSILPIFLIILALLMNAQDIINFDFFVLWTGLREMQPIIVIVLVIPLIGLVLRQEPYLESILIYFSKWLKSSTLIHFGLLILTQLVAFFLLPATAPVVYEFIKDNFGRGEQWVHIKITAIYRSVTLAGIWAFSFPSFAYAVEALQVPLFIAMFHGLILTITGIFLSVFFISIYVKKNKAMLIENRIHQKMKANLYDSTKIKKTTLEFLLLLFTLLGSILILNFLLPFSLLTIIPFIVILWTMLYLLFKRNPANVVSDLRIYLTNDIFTKRKEIILFMAAGLIISSLETSGIGEILITWIYEVTDNWLWFNFLIILPLIITFLGLVGIPPSAAMILVAGLVKNIYLPYPSETIVIALTLGTVTSVLLSPIAVPGILLSSVNGLKPWQNSVQKNFMYAISFFVIAEVYIFFLNFLL